METKTLKAKNEIARFTLFLSLRGAKRRGNLILTKENMGLLRKLLPVIASEQSERELSTKEKERRTK
ncbi:hypothetical protein KAW96_03550 [candidate division WOR-3 bacterium]|nr:hypothetical protein [candidate division WOR-3 bacterium]